MGFFASLFGKDWSAELEKVERDLNNDDPVLALDRARKVVKGAPEGHPVKDRAEALVGLAQAALIARARSRAQAGEGAGELADAIDWLGSALAHENEPTRRSELERWRERLLEDLDRGASPLAARRSAGPEIEDDGEDDDGSDHDPLWEAWVAPLADHVVERWEGRPRAFELAVVGTNDGRVEEALETLDGLVAAAPRDGVIRFERGRAHLAKGNAEAAVEDLEVAWEDLGDAPLDVTGALSIPAMWGEAQLALGNAVVVVDRLEDCADPSGSTGLEPALVYAHALGLAGRLDDADAALARLIRFAPKDSRLPLERAAVLVASGRQSEAIQLLDAVVTPTCRPGCGTAPHLPSLRALASLVLDAGEDPERARELVVFVAHRNGGALSALDHHLLARYYDLVGNTEAAAEAREEAAALVGVDVDTASPMLAPAGRRSVL